MTTQTTNGVSVSVSTEFQPDYSSASQQHYVFTYKITIENNSDHTVQLIRRHWWIFDSNGILREVEGEGVVGQQPVLEPGNQHTYISGCNLKTDIGKMVGVYTMERLMDGKLFEVSIPEFVLEVPYRMN